MSVVTSLPEPDNSYKHITSKSTKMILVSMLIPSSNDNRWVKISTTCTLGRGMVMELGIVYLNKMFGYKISLGNEHKREG